MLKQNFQIISVVYMVVTGLVLIALLVLVINMKITQARIDNNVYEICSNSQTALNYK